MTSRHAVRRRRAMGGGAIVEFALIIPIYMTLILGVVDFGGLQQSRVAMNDAARAGARYATEHPLNWSSATSPPSNTIEFQVMANSTSVKNLDANLKVEYYLGGGGAVPPTKCGEYRQSTNTFVGSTVGATTYTQATCVMPGNLVSVTAKAVIPLSTPLAAIFSAGVTVSAIDYDTLLSAT